MPSQKKSKQQTTDLKDVIMQNNKPIRFLTTTTKGGSGKSTISQQVAATWLLSRTGAAALIELDDQNQDSKWMEASKIETTQIAVEGDATFAVLDVFERFAGKSFSLDLGNQTAEAAVAAMGKLKQLAHFDLIFVPVRDVGQDLINAERTVDLLREYEPDCKITFVLNGLPRQTQDPNDRRLRAFYGDVFDRAEAIGVPVMILPGIEAYGMSRQLGMTLFEIAEQADELTELFQKRGLELDRQGDGKRARQQMTMLQVISAAQAAAGHIKKLHELIDETAGGVDK